MASGRSEGGGSDAQTGSGEGRGGSPGLQPARWVGVGVEVGEGESLDGGAG